jgi:hypothetical protein
MKVFSFVKLILNRIKNSNDFNYSAYDEFTKKNGLKPLNFTEIRFES